MSNHWENLLFALDHYVPWNEQEKADKEMILSLIRQYQQDILLRENLVAHMTASAWVISTDRSSILMAHHNLYNSWSWLGGHADGTSDLLAVSRREVEEESGAVAVPLEDGAIFSLESLCVDGHEKYGRYVPSHLHLNVTYLLEADKTMPLRIAASENSAVAWFSVLDAPHMSTEQWFASRIYSKLNDKLRDLGLIRF